MNDVSRAGTMRCLRLSGIICASLVAPQTFAQGDPLFASNEPLDITIEMPMDVVIKDADEKPVVDGVLRYENSEGTQVSIELTMTTRGRSRLAYCKFPPLKINLKKKQTEGSLFAGQNKLKIVTHCRTGDTHMRYLRQEFGIYKAYNELTDFSFRARWLTVTYKDSAGKRDDMVHDAFFIESNREVGERHGRERVMDHRIAPTALDPIESSRYALFQYLIANTDWSMLQGPDDEGCCHNGKILREPGSTQNWVVLPYDFDQAGLISTSYATPSEVLPIRSVRNRLYRGRCNHNGQLAKTIAQFNERRPALENHLAPAELSDSKRNYALKYINKFFETVNDPKKLQREIYNACLGVH
jgi:hypothetical protein